MGAGNYLSTPCWLMCTKLMTSCLLVLHFPFDWAQDKSCDFPSAYFSHQSTQALHSLPC